MYKIRIVLIQTLLILFLTVPAQAGRRKILVVNPDDFIQISKKLRGKTVACRLTKKGKLIPGVFKQKRNKTFWVSLPKRLKRQEKKNRRLKRKIKRFRRACKKGSTTPWQGSLGIPNPEFGISQTYRIYDDPEKRNPALTYTQNSEGGFYTHYVDNTHPDATDTNNLYGTATVPRLTLPIHDTRYPTDQTRWLQAGSVVEVHGGPYNYPPETFPNPRDGISVYSNGTVDQPVFIRGAGAVKPALGAYHFYVNGQYLIIENLKFQHTTLHLTPSWNIPILCADYVSLRNSEFIGTGEVSGVGAIKTYGLVSDIVSNVVVYNNHIHHYGMWDYPYTDTGGDENDAMGVNVCRYSENIWVLNNHIHHNGGDSVHVGNQAGRTTHHVYIAGNDMHDDRENAVDVKEAQDVIISQNKMYSYHELGRNDDGTIGVTHQGTIAGNDCPKNIWWIFNEMYDATYAAHSSHTSEGLYFIGNVIHDIPSEPGDSAHSKAISPYNFTANERHYYIGNTIYNVEAGIIATVDSADASILIANNIFGSLSEGAGNYWKRHIWIDHLTSGTTLDNNLFYQEGAQALIVWNNSIYNLGQIQSLIGECLNCLEGDPLFTDLQADNVHLQSSSPAQATASSSSAVEAVYNTFEQLYGLDIRKGKDGNSLTAHWDIGAYQCSPQ